MIPDKERSLRKGAVEPWNKPHYKAAQAELRRFAMTARRLARYAVEGPARRAPAPGLEGDEAFQGVVGFFRWLETKYKVRSACS